MAGNVPSSLRRHFRSHIRNSQFLDGEVVGETLDPVATPFDGLAEGRINEEAVSEAVVRALLGRIERLEKEQRVVRGHCQ